MMYSIDEIQSVTAEISSRCNAACPLCPRNFHGYPYNDGYVERDMTLAEAKIVFSNKFIQQLSAFYINGNFGDCVMNPETVDIVEYVRNCSSTVKINISTNGGARNKKFWQALARLDVKIDFCIDGLGDTHSLYRQNTRYDTVIKNAKNYISAGGQATWKMIDFDHNRHQQKEAESISKQLGFVKFWLVDHGRNQGPVFDKNKKLVHVMGTPPDTNFDSLIKLRTENKVLLEDITTTRTIKPIDCKAKKSKSLYVSSAGDVYPCPFLGFSPTSYGHGNYHAVANSQFRSKVQKNNALTYTLEDCITWFNDIENTWCKSSFEAGRLIICNDVCGQKQ